MSKRLATWLADLRRRGVFAVLALYVVGAWVVLQVAALAFPGWDIPDAAIRYVWLAAILLFPVALVVGWRYDLGSHGIARTMPGGDGRAAALGRADRFILAGLLAVSVAVVVVLGQRVLDMREPNERRAAFAAIPDSSIAVLPFANMSDDPDNEYFGDGIAEQLLTELSRIAGLHVAARTSSFYYKDREESIANMGRALGVRTLLEGSVRKAGDVVRVTAQLIDATNGYHLWSATYDRPLDDILAVQDEIAVSIAATLELELLGREREAMSRGGTDDAQAFDLYLRAMAARQTGDDDALPASNELLQGALEIDPDFALALDALAYNYLLQGFDGTRDREPAMQEAGILLARALSLEPRLEQAHASLGLLKSMAGAWADADAHYAEALAINPNYFGGLLNHGLSLVHQSRLKEASAAYLRAVSLDPLNGDLNFNLGALLMLQGQFADGRDFVQKAVAVRPDVRLPRASLTHWLAQYGRLVEAVQNGRATLREYPGFQPNRLALARAYALLGLYAEAEAVLDEAERRDAALERARAALASAQGDHGPLDAIVAAGFAALDRAPGDPLSFSERLVVRDYGLVLLRQSRDGEAADVLDWAVGGETGVADVTYDYMLVLKLLALARQRSGRPDAALPLIERCRELALQARENGWATPVLSVRLAEVHVLAGDLQSAVDELGLAVDKGFRDLAWIEHGIFWQDLQDEPAVVAQMLRMLEDVERQRRELEALTVTDLREESS